MSEANTDFTRHAAVPEAGRRLGGQAFETNKNRLMPCREEAGLATVTVQFEGRGDFSPMGEVVAFDGDNITKGIAVAYALGLDAGYFRPFTTEAHWSCGACVS
jgi:hypothetical protein